MKNSIKGGKIETHSQAKMVLGDNKEGISPNV
jgi:hypothetical protein